MITGGKFAPGQRLLERELCETLSVSRTVVREALRQLESEGLVTTQANRGPFVASISPVDIHDLYDVRGALEGTAARLFSQRASDDQIDRISSALDRVCSAYEEESVAHVIAAKSDYYDILYEGCRSEIMRSMLQSILRRIARYRAMGVTNSKRSRKRLQKGRREMKAIQTAFQKRDGEAAEAAAVEHIRHLSEVVMQEVLAQQPKMETQA